MRRSLLRSITTEPSFSPKPETVKGNVIRWTEKGRNWLVGLWRKTEEVPREVLMEVTGAPEKTENFFVVDEAMSDKGVRLEISGLFKDFKIEDFPNDPKPLLTNDLIFLIKTKRWDLSGREQNGRIYVDIKPKVSETLREVPGKFIDTDMAQLNESGEVELRPDSGYSINLPLTYQEGLIHRGIYSGEMRNIMEDGLIRTQGGAVNNIGGHEGLTFFTNLPDLAEGYATKAGRVQGAYYPSFDQPNYIVTITKPAEVAFEGGSGEVGISQAVPLSDIISIVEVRPYEIKAGIIPLETDGTRVRPVQGLEAWQNPLQLTVAYRIVSIDELRSQLLV